jgi:hypothetical protein
MGIKTCLFTPPASLEKTHKFPAKMPVLNNREMALKSHFVSARRGQPSRCANGFFGGHKSHCLRSLPVYFAT